MKIEEFIELCAGNWFSQRTNYHLDQTKVENSKSDLTVERLAHDRPEIATLCGHYQIAPNDTLGGIKTAWDNSADWGKPKQVGSAILVLVPDRDNSHVGQLIHALAMPGRVPVLGRYALGVDEAFSAIVEANNTYLEERLWFASNNLRLRTTLIKTSNGFSKTAFYSEIRKVASKG